MNKEEQEKTKDITLEDLGYNSIYTHPSTLTVAYRKYEDGEDKNIEFWLDYKEIHCFTYDKESKIEYKLGLNIEELQAIHNKCKELGWLDE